MSAKEIKVYEAQRPLRECKQVYNPDYTEPVVLKRDHDTALQELEAENQRLRDFLEGLNEMYPDFIEKTLVVEDREGFFELLNKEKVGE